MGPEKVLVLDALNEAIGTTRIEVLWKPAHPEGILCIPLLDEGMSGGVEVPSYKQRRPYQGIAVAVNQTRWVQVGDLVCWDQGRAEQVTTACGEVFFYITERNVSGLDEEFYAR